MRNLYQVALVASGLILFFACGNSTGDKTTDSNNLNSNTAADTGKKDTTFKIYSLPAPMQIAVAIRNNEKTFSEEFLKPTNQHKTIEGTNSTRSIQLGIYGVDMGYCMMYDQNQAVIDYLSKISKTADELKVSEAFNGSMAERLKKNMNDKDSASYILLSSFNKARAFFRDNKREECSYLIGAGSFIEGLHLTLSVYKKKPSKELLYLVGQQKAFLASIIELLSNTGNTEMKDLVEQLTDLKKTYDQVTVTFVPSTTDKNVTNISDVSVPDGVLDELLKKTDAIRDKLVN